MVSDLPSAHTVDPLLIGMIIGIPLCIGFIITCVCLCKSKREIRIANDSNV